MLLYKHAVGKYHNAAESVITVKNAEHRVNIFVQKGLSADKTHAARVRNKIHSPYNVVKVHILALTCGKILRKAVGTS